MHLLPEFLLSLSSNVDNLAVGLAYGDKKLRINLLTNLFIAFVSALGTFLSISVGIVIGNYLPSDVANFLGSALLVAIGVWGIQATLKRERKKRKRQARLRQQMQIPIAVGIYGDSTTALNQEIYEEFSKETIREFSYETYIENPAKADSDRSGTIDIREAIALAFGLSLNNLSSGIGAGISELDAIATTVLTFSFSVLGITGGYILGRRFTVKLSGLKAGMISGSLMLIIGIYEYFVV
jgi:putative Mn2+ efflux pump MntP